MKNKQLYSFLLVLTFLFGLSFTASKAHAAQWKQEPSLLVANKSSNGYATTIKDKIYYFQDQIVQIYNLSDNSWTFGNCLPLTYTQCTYATHNEKVYVISGISGTTQTGRVVIYNTITDSWTTGKAIPHPIQGATAQTINGKIYVIGGAPSDYKSKYVQIYDIVSNSWTVKTIPKLLIGSASQLYNGEIYIFGGFDLTNNYNDVNIYNPATNTWRSGPSMNIRKRDVATVLYGTKIYVMGGRDANTLDNVEILDLETNTWSSGANLTLKRKGAQAILVNDKIYLMGGLILDMGFLTLVESLQLNSIESLEPQLKVVIKPEEQLQLTINEDMAKNKKMLWSSSDPTIVTVDSDGMIKAIQEGNAIITVTSSDHSYTETIKVLVVNNAAKYRLTIDLKSDEKCKLTIDDAKDLIGNWVSMDSTIATVTEKGSVTAVAKGLTIVTGYNDNGVEVGQIYIMVK